jgi:UDP-N-acetylglucosamine 4,6-dehydratase (inverting)
MLYSFLNYDFDEIRIFSRDEKKQEDLRLKLNDPRIKFYIGDVRDANSINDACKKIDFIFHAAALKQVPAAEYNPMEFIKTNVIGSQNLIDACIQNDVKKVVALSTDKAAAPVNLYGATKLCADKLFIAANNIIGDSQIRLSVVRYGNVMGSRGSVIPFFINKAKKSDIFPITDERMTRFNITLEEGVNNVIYALNNSLGGEIFVPKIASFRILDLAEAISPKAIKDIVGCRPGEKIHEVMITESDSNNTYEFEKNFIILPNDEKFKKNYENKGITLKKVPEGFSYDSKNNSNFLTVNQIRTLIIENIDKKFTYNE